MVTANKYVCFARRIQTGNGRPIFSISGSYKIETNMDTKLPYLEHKYVTLYVEYHYSDVANEAYPMNYKVTGSMIMERKRNINIPDEDQSYIW